MTEAREEVAPPTSQLDVPPPSTRLAPPAPSEPGGRGRTGLLVGVGLVVVAVLAGWQFLSGPEPGPVGPVTPVQPTEPAQPVQPTEPAQPVQPTEPARPDDPVTPQPVEPERPPANVNQTLAEIVPATVGSYVLEDVAEMPSLIEVGAVGSLQMTYVSGGSSIYHAVAAFDEAAASVEMTHGYARYLAEEQGYGLVADEGLENGHVYILEQSDTVVVVWSNDVLWALVEGHGAAIQEFFPELPY